MRRWPRRLFVFFFALVLCTAVFLGYLHTDTAKSQIARFTEKYLQTHFGLHTQLKGVDYTLIPLEIRCSNFTILSDAMGKFLSGAIRLQIPYSTLWRKVIRVKNISVDISFANLKNFPHPDLSVFRQKTITIDRLSVHGAAFQYAAFQLNDVGLRASAGSQNLRIQEVHASVGSTRLSAKGNLHIPDGAAELQYGIEGEAEDFSAITPGKLPLRGLFKGSGELHGKPGLYSIVGKLSGKSFSVKDLPSFDLTASYLWNEGNQAAPLNFDLHSNAFPVISSLISISGQGSLHYSGGFDFLRGKATFQMQLSPRPPTAMNVSGTVAASFQNGIVSLLKASLNAKKQGWATSSLLTGSFDIIHSTGHLSIDRAIIRRSNLQGTIENSRIQIAPARLTLALHGQLPVGSYESTAIIPLSASAPMHLQASASSDLNLLSSIFPGFAAQGHLSTQLEVHGTRLHPLFNAELQTSDFALNFASRMSLQRGTALLKVNGKSWRPIDWDGEASIQNARLRLPDLRVETPVNLQLQLSRGLLLMKQTELKIPLLLQATAGGVVDFRRGLLDFNFQADSDLRLLNSFVPNTEASGKVTSWLKINGPLHSPQWTGALKLQDGRLRTSATPYGLEQIQFSGQFSNQNFSVQNFSGNIAGGEFYGGGGFRFVNWKLDSPSFWIRAKHLGFNYPENIQSEIEAQLNASIRQGTPFISGEIDLSHVIVTRKIDMNVRSLNSLLLEKLSLSSIRSHFPVRLGIKVNNKDPLSISNNLGRILADVNLQISGNSITPQIQGEIHVKEGSQLFLQTRQFIVERGIIRLDAFSKAPKLDLVLSSSIADDQTKVLYQVKLPINGPMDNLRDLTPQSSPPLLPEQIYFLLLTGRTDAQLTHSEARFMRQQLLAYYSAHEILPVPEKVPEKSNLNSVNIYPELISSERDPATGIVKGKHYFAGVSLIYALPLDSSQEQLWIANYRASKNLQFRFIDQEDGSYSSTLQRTFRFGESPQATKPKIAKSPFVKIFNSFGSGSSGQKKKIRNVNLLFEGYQPEAKDVEQYQDWFQEGFSEEAVRGMVAQDVLQKLWENGFHNAKVQWSNSSFHVTPAVKFTRVNLTFHGTDQISVDDLKGQLKSLGVSPADLETDAIHDFNVFRILIGLAYVKNGFLQTSVREGKTIVDAAKGKIVKIVEIEEGPRSRIGRISVSDSQQFSDELRRGLKVRVGDVPDSTALQEDELTIGRFYEARGYSNVKVRGEVIPSGTDLTIVYDLETGEITTVNKISIHGNHRTDAKFIQNALPLNAGDILIQEKLGEAQKRLSDSKLFRDVKVRAQQTAIQNRYDIVVDVVETGAYEVAYGGGFNSEKKLEGILQISDWNLFGHGQSLSFVSKVNSEDRVARLVYHVPDFSGLRWKTLASASYERLEQPLFITLTKGFQLQRQFHFFDPLVLVGDYRFERVRVTEKDPTDVYFVGEAPVNLSRVDAMVITDTRDDPLQPKSGSFLSIQTGIASSILGSGISFVKNYSQFFHYHSFGKKVWASGIRLGLANPFGNDLIATERFFAGGSFSLRGFEKDEVGPRDPVWGRPIGGEAVLLINQELRFPLPIHQWVGGAVFYDAGNVYNRVSDFQPLHLRHSLGIGLRLDTPVGIGRIDWGINLDRKSGERRSVFHFALGQAF